MYRTQINFHKRLSRGENPIPYIVINTHLGYRAYAEKELSYVFDLLGYLLDGSFDLDGSVELGSATAGVIEKSARVLSFGLFERTLQPEKDDVLTSMLSKQKQHISISMDNADNYFAKLIVKEPFLSRELSLYIGFDLDPQDEHICLFTGTITELSVLPIMTIEADEQ